LSWWLKHSKPFWSKTLKARRLSLKNARSSWIPFHNFWELKSTNKSLFQFEIRTPTFVFTLHVFMWFWRWVTVSLTSLRNLTTLPTYHTITIYFHSLLHTIRDVTQIPKNNTHTIIVPMKCGHVREHEDVAYKCLIPLQASNKCLSNPFVYVSTLSQCDILQCNASQCKLQLAFGLSLKSVRNNFMQKITKFTLPCVWYIIWFTHISNQRFFYLHNIYKQWFLDFFQTIKLLCIGFSLLLFIPNSSLLYFASLCILQSVCKEEECGK